ncbi:MAG: alkyl hydroperoxide reductase, partial [Planctomycetes bacterium]|nr:alkyl hydroperoxide reductase [Planctomycetota bacterium]
FGTWCPNCTDEAKLLARLSPQYKKRGLQILGIAFEHGDDQKGQLARIQKWKAALQIPYPVILGGSSNKAKASKRFPIIDAVRAYPTTLFLNADGTTEAIHTGFTGPAAGKEHAKLVGSFELLIEKTLVDK